MGQEGSRAIGDLCRTRSPRLLGIADKEAIVLHCLPAYRGKEIDAR